MKRGIIIIIIFLLANLFTKAQKFEINYGTIIGLNTSFINAKTELDSYYPFHELDRNFTLNNSYESKTGYNIGLFFSIKPSESRFSLESGIYLHRYSNKYTVSLLYDAYYTISSIDSWMAETAQEVVSNDFTVIKIPVIFGYKIYEKSKFNVDIQGGFTANINMDKDHIVTDMNMNEHQLYSEFYTGYLAGIKLNLSKVICQLRYERSFNIMDGASRDFFPWEIDVDKLYLSAFSFSVGYTF